MKPHRRDKLDKRIAAALKAGLLNHRAPRSARYYLLRAAAVGTGSPLRLAARADHREWISPSTARLMRRERWSMEGRRYGYVLVTTSFRLAW